MAIVAFCAACLGGGTSVTAHTQSRADATPVVVIGGFTNVRYGAEHAYGQEIELWRRDGGVVGLFSFTDGRQADFNTGVLENVTFDPATHRLSFVAYASQFRFEGTLEDGAVKGLLTRMHPVSGAQTSADQVVLKRNQNLTESMHDYPSVEEWTRFVDPILKRLGPNR